MTDYKPIDCAQYDWLEIACMDGYRVEFELGDRKVIGVAIDLRARDGEEFLQIRHGTGESEDVRVDQIRSMTVLTRPARFTYQAFPAAAG